MWKIAYSEACYVLAGCFNVAIIGVSAIYTNIKKIAACPAGGVIYFLFVFHKIYRWDFLLHFRAIHYSFTVVKGIIVGVSAISNPAHPENDKMYDCRLWKTCFIEGATNRSSS